MSLLVFSLFFLVSFCVFSERGSPEVPFFCAILQIYSRHIILVESSCSPPPQHLLSSPSWIWIWSLPAEFSLHISTTSPRCPLLSWRNLSLLLSSESPDSYDKSYHPQGTNLAYSYVYGSEKAGAEEDPLLLSSECYICQEEDRSDNFDNPCVCNDNLKYAHRICVQRWSNDKENIICGICSQQYQFVYLALSSLTTSLNTIIWPSCSAILARFVQRGPSRVAHHPCLKLSWLASSVLKSGLSKPKLSRFGISETYSGLSDGYFSFKERAPSSFSSQWERSIIPPSSITERMFPSLPYSSYEETFGVQPQILPLSVDTSLTGFKAHFLTNSTELESIFQSELIASVMLLLSDTHVDFYEILQAFRNLKKCFISMLMFRLSLCTSWILCFNCRVFGLITILCTLKV